MPGWFEAEFRDQRDLIAAATAQECPEYALGLAVTVQRSHIEVSDAGLPCRLEQRQRLTPAQHSHQTCTAKPRPCSPALDGGQPERIASSHAVPLLICDKKRTGCGAEQSEGMGCREFNQPGFHECSRPKIL
jgi:hypothetical protein